MHTCIFREFIFKISNILSLIKIDQDKLVKVILEKAMYKSLKK